MRNFSYKILLVGLLLSVSVACQHTFYPEARLQKTALAVSPTIATDEEVEKTILPYRNQVTAQMAEVVGFAPVALEKLAVESPIGNFVADLQRQQAQMITGKPVDMGLMTAGGIRTP